MTQLAARSRVALALVEAAAGGEPPTALVAAFCNALASIGVPLARAAVGSLILHPLLDATLIIWKRDGGVAVEDTPRPLTRGNEAWRRSPFFRLLTNDGRDLRYRLELGEGRGDYPVLDEMTDAGITDYLVLRFRLGPTVTLGANDDLYSSWATDRPGGFSDAEITLLRELEPLLAFIVASSITGGTARTLLSTYLGSDAAQRVLGGAIERGRAEPIQAVIWYSDLEGFTRLTDSLPSHGILDLLNAYAELMVDAIEAEGGHVLKFIGDGILAIFPDGEPCDACAAALRSWRISIKTTAALNEERAAAGRPVTRPYLALHVGEVLYGNIGGRSRLDFTVLGPAVNEASRIAAMCRGLDQPVILSEAFARSSGRADEDLAALGRFILRGVSRPQMLYGLIV
jgi:adenylate cyclase